jgi:hypothetical protein
LDKTAVGLSNVDNTTDLLKPISTATQTALNGKQATISLTTTGSSGASTFAANVLNIPTYTLSGLGGQPLATNLTSISALTFASTSFVKMTASGTFALDTNTYLTAETDTLASVTGRGNTTTNFITIGGVTSNRSVTASGGIARGNYFNNTLVASANGDTLVGLDINPTFTVGAFTGVIQINARFAGRVHITNQFLSIGTNSTSADTNYGNGFITSFNQTFGLQGSGGTRYMQMFQTTGNFVFQNGGTFTDAGYRLDVVGADSRFNGIRAGLGAGQVAGNTVFGNGALGINVSGTGIVAIGFEALKVSTGNNNTSIGYQTLVAVTTGNTNTAIGTSCAIETTTGIRNTYVGALITSSANAANNTAIGTSTVGTGNNNCIMGYLASSGGFSGSVVLGREATATASNQFVIGSNSMPSGAVAIEVNTSTRVWNVIINGTARKILLA